MTPCTLAKYMCFMKTVYDQSLVHTVAYFPHSIPFHSPQTQFSIPKSSPWLKDKNLSTRLSWGYRCISSLWPISHNCKFLIHVADYGMEEVIYDSSASKHLPQSCCLDNVAATTTRSLSAQRSHTHAHSMPTAFCRLLQHKARGVDTAQ